MKKPIYSEEFINSRISKDAHSISYVLEQIKEVHSSEFGWTVSEPTIIPNPDGKTVTLKVKLEKYEVNKKRTL